MENQQRGKDSLQDLLKTIAESNILCYQAQWHYVRARNLAAGQSYMSNLPKDHLGRKEDLLVALRETHDGCDKLNKSFMSILMNLMLDQSFPVLTSQIGSIPVGDLERLDNRSSDLFSRSGSIEDKQHTAKPRKILKHCCSMLQFLNRCQDIAAHQRKLLEAVECQIRAENPSVDRAGHQVDPWKPYFHYHSQNRQYHQYQRQHALAGSPHMSIKSERARIPNQISFTQNHLETRHFPAKIAAKAPTEQTVQHLYHYDPNKSLVIHEKPYNANDNSKDDEFEPLSIDEGMDISTGVGDLGTAKSKDDEFEPLSIDEGMDISTGAGDLGTAKSKDDEFEPLSIDEGMDISTGVGDLGTARTVASSIAQASALFTPDEIFPDVKSKINSPDDTALATGNSTKKVAVPISRRGRRKSQHHSSLIPAVTREQLSPLRGARRVRSTGSYPKHQHRRPPRRFKKPKGDGSLASRLSLSSSSSADESRLSLALGGRNDFMEKDSAHGKARLRSLEHGIGDSDTDENEKSSICLRSFSY